jgi:hypothetical protein
MNPIQRKLYENAARERSLVCDWLMELMRQSSEKPTTKDVLREIAIEKFKISKQSFDAGWDMAIMKTGYEHWWEPLRKKKKAAQPVN